MSGRGTASAVRGEAQAYPPTPPGATCGCQDPHRKLHAGIFFDGTNNNMYRDWGAGKGTNVARLFKLYRETSTADAVNKKLYIVGVGSMDQGGRARQAGRDAVNNSARSGSIAAGVGSSAGSYVADVGHDLAGKIGGAGGKARLNQAYQWLKSECAGFPRPAIKTVDVYGFSRGAALARTFVNLVNLALRRSEPNIFVRFVGVFDTVGSFGLPGDDSDPGQNLYIDSTDARGIAHYTARHEYRQNFPLTVITGIDKEYAGAHSDVGGGYEPVDGDGRVNHIAFIPYKDMHRESRRMQVAMDENWQQYASGVDVEALRRKADEYAGSGAVMTAPNSPWLRERGEFFDKYIHESASTPSRWWYLAGPAGYAYRNAIAPNRHDSSGARRKFTPRRLRLKGMPPDFDWE